ncbi:sialic acid-binding Ig-like lectin 13 isoform X1 [Castor canadensis]|uniref:Sialic acid-binding Ig-like lectin 13 isoform X1 n=3 Tax=Castor canadensis TaxID=51338 RepID=A0AC58LAM0_CASCN
MLVSPLLSLLWAGSMTVDLDQRLQIMVQESVTVQEGLCVLVPCRFFYYPFFYRYGHFSCYWFREGADTDRDSPVATNNPARPVQKETQGRFQFLGDQQRMCSLSIRDAQRGDSGSYFIHVESGSFQRSYHEQQVLVNVTALNHSPYISIPGALESGFPSNLTCSVPWACEQGTPPFFSWTGASVTSLDTSATHSSELTLIPRPQDHGTTLTCQVTFPGAGVTVESTIQLNVSYDEKNPPTHPTVVSRRAGSGPMAEVVLVATGEAAVKILLLGLCLIFLRVRSRRKKASRSAGRVENAKTVTD